MTKEMVFIAVGAFGTCFSWVPFLAKAASPQYESSSVGSKGSISSFAAGTTIELNDVSGSGFEICRNETSVLSIVDLGRNLSLKNAKVSLTLEKPPFADYWIDGYDQVGIVRSARFQGKLEVIIQNPVQKIVAPAKLDYFDGKIRRNPVNFDTKFSETAGRISEYLFEDFQKLILSCGGRIIAPNKQESNDPDEKILADLDPGTVLSLDGVKISSRSTVTPLCTYDYPDMKLFLVHQVFDQDLVIDSDLKLALTTSFYENGKAARYSDLSLDARVTASIAKKNKKPAKKKKWTQWPVNWGPLKLRLAGNGSGPYATKADLKTMLTKCRIEVSPKIDGSHQVSR